MSIDAIALSAQAVKTNLSDEERDVFRRSLKLFAIVGLDLLPALGPAGAQAAMLEMAFTTGFTLGRQRAG